MVEVVVELVVVVTPLSLPAKTLSLSEMTVMMMTVMMIASYKSLLMAIV